MSTVALNILGLQNKRSITMIKQEKCDVIVDLQYGSTGKGLIAGVMAKKFGYDTVMTANMPNAGHTFIDNTGRKWVHKILPNGIVSPNLRKVMIGPGAIFDVQQLLSEIEGSADILKQKEIIIHPNSMVLHPTHKKHEQATLNHISSTMQGSAAAMAEKIGRSTDANIAKNVMQDFIGRYRDTYIHLATHDDWAIALIESEQILLEGAQGFSLGINERFYPYCTSRDCTPARFMADCSVPLKFMRRVVGTARVHPIRVGNTTTGFSGDCYEDQKEMSWEEIGVEPETTTVTGRVRRVFTFSEKQIRDAIFYAQPDWIFLNFCNYAPELAIQIVNKINAYMQIVGTGGQVMFTGWGPKEGDVRMQGMVNPCDYTEEESAEGYV